MLSTNPRINTDIFVAHFSDLMVIISKERKQCILMGDFNLDLIKVDIHNQTKYFVHSLYTNVFYPTISKPTCVTEHSATLCLLDNIITNITGYCIKSGVLYNDISDHFPVFNVLQIDSKTTKKYEYIFKRMTTANNIEKLNTELKNANWDDVFIDEKIAKVIPLYKIKDPVLFCNYRPISFLPVFSKILERLMYNQLYNFLTEHNILSMNQFGFRKNYSTFLALMDLVDNISKTN